MLTCASTVGTALPRQPIGDDMKTSMCMFGALLAIAVVPTAVAHADDNDTLFLSTIKHHIAGITNTEGDAGLIKLGHAVCDDLTLRRSRASMHDHLTAKDWSDSDASWLITASVAAYCPWVP